MLAQILVSAAASVAAYFILHAIRILYRNLSAATFSGYLARTEDSQFPHRKSRVPTEPGQRTEFGPNFIFRTLFSVSVLHTSDLRALNHLVTHSDIYRNFKLNVASFGHSQL
ncbi:hypothetical protein C8F01DRAFT_1183647 [Mycena amicta]|nr:hypothetical protein C8F01DRAFT_1183647 [Mycena amicta]